ncbi:MAG: hypothetical protein DHS20C05_07710 [Hyphococcus sp.]|nr:MAG: hypothetical protein DHS20C05_07710 [Marinicaulis sp.]
MARSQDGSVKFGGPGQFILNMVLFLLAVGAVLYYLSPWSPQPTNLLMDAFNANQGLNGLILAVLVFGIIYNLTKAEAIYPSIRWMNAYKSRRSLPRRTPGLITAAESLLPSRSGGRQAAITAEASRAILDSIGTRIDEGREMGRYIMNLLVFLGLLGTFWGLLETVNAVAATINGLATAGGAAEDAVTQLIVNLQEPLSGMGTAFSSSLFGLGGSLVVGFLDLQTGQAQNRFYTDMEDLLADRTEMVLASARDGSKLAENVVDEDLAMALQNLEAALAANTETQIKALAGQNAELKDEIRALNRTLIRVGGGE